MIKFSRISQIEHKYAFENAVAGANTFNGAFGTVTAGIFEVDEDATKAIMNLEVGDEAGLGTYPIAEGNHVRVVDLEAFDGEIIEIYGDELPDGAAVGNKLKSDTSGALVIGTADEITGEIAAPYYEVTKVIKTVPNTKGVEVKVVAQ